MSCLIEKFSYYVTLNDTEKELLGGLEKDVQSYKKRDLVFEQDEDSRNVFVVRNGWAVSYTHLEDGKQLILGVHFPGDIVGTTTLPFRTSVCGLMAVTDMELCPFPKSGVKEMLRDSPKLSALMYAMGMQDNVVLIDRLRAVGRMKGDDRIALFLMQVWTRLKITNPSITNTFTLPLSQEMIGDALGLTPVYVNRMLKKLRTENCIAVQGREITLLDPDRLEHRCGFNDRYYKLDTDWYPD